jgi:hypothetical protein
LPRKYRPPAARRRKSKRPAPYFVEPVPQAGDGAVSSLDDSESALQVEAPPALPSKEAPVGAGAKEAPPATKHIARDYSYVRAEIRRIVIVAGFLIVSLIITAILRN